jgi:hypothetical protein
MTCEREVGWGRLAWRSGLIVAEITTAKRMRGLLPEKGKWVSCGDFFFA